MAWLNMSIDMKNLFIMCVVIALALAETVSASGQTTALTLNDCMRYAISNSTKVRIQQAAIGDAQIDRRDAALALFTPQINAQTVAYYNFGRNIDPETNLYIQTTSFHNSYGVSAGYDLFDGFKAVNNYKISKTGLLIAQAVMEAYYNVVYYKRLTDVYEEQVATAESALKKAKRQEELGQKGHADVIQMEADLADRQYDLTNTFNKYQSEKMKLADLMFWPVDEELVIDTSMPEWEVEPVSTSAVVNFALDHNPGVNVASWKELNARRELTTAKWQLMPSIGLYGGWNTNYFTYPNEMTVPFGTGWPRLPAFPRNATPWTRPRPSWTRSAGMWRAKYAGPSRTATVLPRLTSKPFTRPMSRTRPIPSISRSWNRASFPRWSSRRPATISSRPRPMR